MPIQVAHDVELSTDEMDPKRAARYHVKALPWEKLRAVLDYFTSQRDLEFYPPRQHSKMRSRTLTSIADELGLNRRQVINACAYWSLNSADAERADRERPTKGSSNRITKEQRNSVNPWYGWKRHYGE